MKTIIYTCPYVPAEWIAAHGLRPSRIIPTAVSTAESSVRMEGTCPYVRAFINELVANKQGSAAVVTTVCDQMRRAFDILVRQSELPAFLMNVPNTWQTVAAQKLYLDELNRLGQFLIQLGGIPPSKDRLAKIMLEYDTMRASIRAARGCLSSRQYSQAIAELGYQGKCSVENVTVDSELSTRGIPLAIIGGPLFKQDFEIFDVVENAGGRIVLDATETGERGLCPAFDRRKVCDNPLMELANAYFGGIPDASRRPNHELYRWLKCELFDRAVCGIIFRRYVWCDIWHAELGRLKDWIDLPVLDVDAGGDNEPYQRRTPNRIHAFLEMLR